MLWIFLFMCIVIYLKPSCYLGPVERCDSPFYTCTSGFSVQQVTNYSRVQPSTNSKFGTRKCVFQQLCCTSALSV